MKFSSVWGFVNDSMPAFNRVVTGAPKLPTLTGDFSTSYRMQKLIMNCRLDLLRHQARNNAILIYFQGQELRAADGRFCLMTKNADSDRAFEQSSSLITSTYLGQQLEGLKCANLLFLDVMTHPESADINSIGDPAQPRLGVLRLSHRENRSRESSPFLLGQLKKVMPRVGELGQVAVELQIEVADQQGLAVDVGDGIPSPIRRMRFGELFAN